MPGVIKVGCATTQKGGAEKSAKKGWIYFLSQGARPAADTTNK